MFAWIRQNSIAFFIALTLHLLFLGALLFNWEFDKPEKIVLKQADIIQTTAVDANSFEAEIRKIEQQKQAEKQRKAQAERKARELKEQKRKEEIRRKQEKKRKAEELKRKKAAEAKKKEEQRKAALLKEKKRKESEKKAAEEKRKKAAAKRKEAARKKAQQEKRRAAEEKKRQEAERKRKAEEEKKRQAEIKRQQERERAELERRSKGIVKRHVALIAQKIERNWRQPLDAPRNLQCKIDIVLRASGHVVSVKVVESSGNASFDRSVETAVRKASPLPVPTDSVIFKQFELMRLRFEPGSY